MFELTDMQTTILILSAILVGHILVVGYSVWPHVRWVWRRLRQMRIRRLPSTVSKLSVHGKGEFASLTATGKDITTLLMIYTPRGYTRAGKEGRKILYEGARRYHDGGFVYVVSIDNSTQPDVLVVGHKFHTAREITEARDAFLAALTKVLSLSADVKTVPPRPNYRPYQAPDAGKQARRSFGRRIGPNFPVLGEPLRPEQVSVELAAEKFLVSHAIQRCQDWRWTDSKAVGEITYVCLEQAGPRLANPYFHVLCIEPVAARLTRVTLDIRTRSGDPLPGNYLHELAVLRAAIAQHLEIVLEEFWADSVRPA
jgi:hypothetical protein